MDFEKILWGAIDKEEPTLIPYELFWSNKPLPTKFRYNDSRVNNQAQPWYEYSCVFFWEANSINEIRNKQKIPWIVKGETLADKAERLWILDKTKWALLINWPKLSKSEWLIDWYVGCFTLEDVKRWLVEQWPIWVWSNQINRDETMKSPFIATKKSSYGHKFIIVWYDDEKKLLICENSYWPQLFDWWRFYIRYEDFDLLYQTKTANFIKDTRFQKLDDYLKLTKAMKMDEFHKQHYETETNQLNKMLKRLAMQIRYIWKINTKELLELIK